MICEIRLIRGQFDLDAFGKLNEMAQSLRVAHMRRDALAHLQRRNGHQQKRRARRARLADHVRLQHVFVSSLEMGRRSFV